jgi:hypothetical protein
VWAQAAASVDATGTHVEYDDDTSAGSLALTPALVLDRGPITANASSTFSRFEGGGWSVEADGSGSVFMSLLGPIQAELAAAGDLTSQPGTSGTGQLGGQARLHAAGDSYGAWLGGELGRATDGFSWQTVRAGEIGGWARYNNLTLLGHVTPTGIGEGIRYVDFQALASLEQKRLELNLFGGVREWGGGSDSPSIAWGGASGAYWLRDYLAIVGAAGKYPADPAEGFSSGTYLSLGVRLATRRPTTRESLTRTAGEPLPPVAKPAETELHLQSAGDGRWTITLQGILAKRVEVMGDFTDWQPVPLDSSGEGRWSVTLPVAPGTHRMNLRIDEGPWTVPPDLPALKDEFSGVVALFTVE